MKLGKNETFLCSVLTVLIVGLLVLSCGNNNSNNQESVTKNGQSVNKFFKIELPKPNSALTGKISAKGTHNYDMSAHIWIVLSDGFGFYLQNPEVTLYDGSWEQNNIDLGGGIKSIIFILVDDNGHSELLQKVKNNDWGQFSDLPKGSKKIAALPIKN